MSDRRPGPHHLLLKASARLRARGLSEAIGLVVARGHDALRSDDVLVVFACRSGRTVPERSDLRVREATHEDAERYARDIGTDSPGTFAARLSDRTMCFVAEAEGRFIHSSWVTTGAAWTRELKRYVRPLPGQAYVYESFTRTEARGRGVYPYVLQAICVHLGHRGIDDVWVAVEDDNPSSMRALAKAGFRPAFEIAYRRRWGRVVVDLPPETGGLEISPSIEDR